MTLNGVRRNNVLLLAAGTVMLAATVWLVQRWIFKHAAPSQNTIVKSDYADPVECVSCHSEIARTYAQTGMARSFHAVKLGDGPENLSARNTLEHQASHRLYTMEVRDGSFFQHRELTGTDAQASEPYENRADYVVGSGNHARTYLHRTAEGKLMELPVSWYRELGGSWGMSPGYDQAGQKDFRRAIGRDCMFCHNGYATEQGLEFSSQEAVFPVTLPEGIDCQRCHGPGAAHVKAARTSGTALQTVRGAILNPAGLSRERQMNVCMQCHLETTSLRLPNSIKRFERTTNSYRPGEPLEDYALYFDHKEKTGFDDRFEVAHQVYRLAKSKCFLKSQMTCTTCHNPHMASRGDAATTHYVSVCVSCHAAPHPTLGSAEKPVTTSSNCMNCHMGKRRTDDVVHVVMTDHYIQRNKPSRDLLAPLKESIPAYHGEVVAYYPNPIDHSRDAELYLAAAQVQHESNLGSGIPRLQKDLEQLKPERAEFYFALAHAYSKQGAHPEAIHWFEEALNRQPDAPAILREFAGELANSGDLNRAAQMGEHAIALKAADTAAMTNLANVYLQQSRFSDAERVLRNALVIDPDLPESNNLLGLALLSLHNPGGAERALRKAVQVQPELAEAQNNLANLLIMRGETMEAESHLRQAIQVRPDYVEAYRGYAMLLASTQKFDEAEKQMKEAVRFKPESATLHSDLAGISLAAGRVPAAEAEYKRSLQLDPANIDAHIGLGNILAAQGHTSQAEDQFRQALKAKPDSEEAKLALAELLAAKK